MQNIIPLWIKDDLISPDRLKNIPKNLNHISCHICNFILPYDKSEACQYCGEQFCFNCIKHYITVNQGKCGNQKCCGIIYKSMILLKSKVEELEDLEIKCKFEKCLLYPKFNQLKIHEKECQFKNISCPSCNNLIEEKDYFNHSQICTENLIQCVSCGFMSKLKDLINHSCELFIYIKNQIKNEYANEKEKLIQEIKKEVIDEIMPQITEYINELKNSNYNISNISNGIENELENINYNVIKNDDSHLLLHNLLDNEILLNNKKRKRSSALKENSIQNENENTPIKSSHHNVFTRQNKNILPFPFINNTIKIQDSAEKISLDENIICLTKINYKNKINFLYGGTKGGIHQYDIQKERIVKSYKEHKSRVLSIKEYKDNLFMSSSDDKTIKIWEIYKEKSVITINQDFYSICLINFEDQIISGDSDGGIRIWNSESGKLFHLIIEKLEGSCTCMILMDYYLIVGGSDSQIKIYNLSSNLCEISLREHSQSIRNLLFFDYQKFISCSEDGMIKVWDFSHDKSLYTLYKFSSSVNDIVFIGSNNILCANQKRIKILNSDLKDVTSEKIVRENVFKIILYEEESKFLCYNLDSPCFYIYSYIHK